MKTALIACLLALHGCATIREHPRTTAAVVGVVATSVILSTKHRREIVFEDVRLPVAPCATDPRGCQ
jgi:hypothetical protein